MMPKHRSEIASGRGTYWLAFIFALVAVIGIAKMFSNPPGISASKSSEQTTVSVQKEPVFERLSYSGYILRTVIFTGVIVVVLLVGAKLYRNRLHLKIPNQINLELKGRKYIGPKHYLLKVNIENRNLLLGVTESSISLLTELTDTPEADSDTGQAEQESDSFRRILNRFKMNSAGQNDL